MSPRKPLLVILNAANDTPFLEELLARLTQLKHDVDVWSIRSLSAGEDFWAVARERSEQADIVLGIFGPEFLLSPAYRLAERALIRSKRRPGSVLLIPFIARPAAIERTPFGQIVPVPREGYPLSRARDRDMAWIDILKDLQQAIVGFQRAAGSFDHEAPAAKASGLNAARERSEPFRRARSLRAAGDIALLRFEHPRAESSYQEALAIYKRIHHSEGAAYCLRRLAEVATDLGRHAEAQRAFEQALEIYLRIRDLEGEAMCRWCLAQLHAVYWNLDAARLQCRAVLK